MNSNLRNDVDYHMSETLALAHTMEIVAESVVKEMQAMASLCSGLPAHKPTINSLSWTATRLAQEVDALNEKLDKLLRLQPAQIKAA